MNRRGFLNASAMATAGFSILPSGILRAANGPNNRLNIALIGVSGRALAHYGWLKEQSVVALCDINEAFFEHALTAFPGAKTYTDWRQCLEHKGLDAVVICTPDHHHAFISNWALNRDLHVYCEKPLAISVEEARIVRQNWLGKKGKLATQVGTQMHAQPNYARIKEMILDGAIGGLESAVGWGNRKIRRDGYFPAAGKPPAGLHWDLWLGPSPVRPYNPRYFSGGPGANCLEWNMFWDWGVGQIGDMGSHMMDMLWNGVDGTLPTSIRATGEAYNPEVTPVLLEAHFEHPANDWRGPIRVSWHQGGSLPRNPRPFIDFDQIGHGVMFQGTQGFIICDYTRRLLIPDGKDADLSYYKPRSAERQLPPIGQFHQNWLDACKDPSKSTCCDFEYHSHLIEQMLLGLVAYRTGETLEYDGANGVVTNHAEANPLLKRHYREGWVLNG
ncbi:MAG: Gfo/Idh/MocA family oxidoreductase [Akkermansiaceae bacterium]|jgi:predicted dehydrogenase|nr:Gfo/Idh/MocA family oxidoreductase [Akkermansiaceae bacterium]